MDIYTTLAIIICLTLLLLALMSKVLNLELEWPEGKKIPKINLTFKKDPELFGFLKKGSGKRLEDKKKENKRINLKKVGDPEYGYVERNHFGSVQVNYGESSETIVSHSVLLKATKDEVDRYVYRNADKDIKIKCISGFLNPHSDFKRMCELGSWDVCESTGLFAGANRILLPISRMRKGEEKKLEYEVRLRAYYKEIQNDMEILRQSFFFRMGSETDKAVLFFSIPKGEVSDIQKFVLLSTYKSERLFSKEIADIRDDIFTCEGSYGSGWMEEKKDRVFIFWSIPSVLKKGQICELEWYIKTKRDT